MKSYLLILFLLISFLDVFSQNLIPNPGFENYTNCPGNIGQLSNTITWNSPTNASPDYFNQCCASSVVNVPVNHWGNQNARTGQAFAGFYIYYPSNYREYIQAELISPLVLNQCYHFEMFVNLADSSSYNTDDIGVVFLNSQYFAPSIGTLNFLYPQIENTTGNYLNTTTWTKISGDYTSSGGESHILIGNFKNNINTSPIFISQHDLVGYAYCYIDDISLIQLPPCTTLPIELLDFSASTVNNSVELAWTTVTETNNDYFEIEKSKDSKNFSSLHKIDGAGNSTRNQNYKYIDNIPLNGISYYRLKQVDFDGQHFYSKIISVDFSSTRNEIRVDPNPASNETTIIFPDVLKGETKIELFNSQGILVSKKYENKEMNSYLLNLEALEKGVYFISIENKQQGFRTRLIVF